MPASDASQLLRPGLLEGVSMVLAVPPVAADGSLGAAVSIACAALGARVWECPLGSGDAPELEQAQAAVERVLAEAGGVELLVVDGAGLFAAAARNGGSGGARSALRSCLDASWSATRAVVNGAFLPAERGGRIVLLAPAPDCGEHAEAARAGIENLARTLSIEWARHAITAVTIVPGEEATSPSAAGEVAALTAYLASPAGAYFSGCLLDLRGTPATALPLSRSSRQRSRP